LTRVSSFIGGRKLKKIYADGAYAAESFRTSDPKAETPTTQPSPVTNAAFGFVQSAVNSLTSTIAKLFEWGRIESGSRP
jgi:hypothetical protein